MARKRERNRALADIGPNTRRLFAVRDGIRGARKALDRGACRDASAILKLTGQEIAALNRKYTQGVDDDTQFHFDVEKKRLAKSCKITLGGRRRRRKAH